MQCSEGKCNKCGKTFPVVKENLNQGFEEIIKEMVCPECGSTELQMIFGITCDVCIGKAGNASTKYETSVVYHPSKFGKFKSRK